MKKLLKILFAAFFDVIFVFIIGKLLLFFSSFIQVPKYPWICYILIFSCYIFFAYFNKWKTIGVKLIFKNNKNELPLFFAFLSIIVDLFVVFSFTILIDRTLRSFLHFDTLFLFWLIAPFYYFLCLSISNQTVGIYFFSFNLKVKDNLFGLTKKIIFKREIVKFGFGFWLPFIILYFISNFTNVYIDCMLIVTANLIFLLIYYTAKNEFWWDTVAKTYKNRTTKPKIIFYPIFFSFLLLVFFILLIYNNINNYSKNRLFGFKYPFKEIEYPYNNNVQPYYSFIISKGQKPKDYILDLFDKYDIVVLCENMHPEDTQWDFIYEVISDERFYKNVGNIFTEYGCVKDSASVDYFMKSTFDSDTALQKATAKLMNYHSGNFYYFIKKLYNLNKNLPDSLKIKEHFTDILGWKYLYNAYNDPTHNDIDNPLVKKRDSLMAQVVIDWYSKERKKCLLITNFRHAFIVNNGKVLENFAVNEAQYIFEKFPERIANVMLYGSRTNIITFKPIHKGIWNSAFKKTGYTHVGFDLKNSPFGNDHFDKFPHFFKPFPYTYSDIFTGLVFYKPENQFTYTKQPFKRYAAEEEYKFAMQNNLIDSVKAKQVLYSYNNNGGQFDTLSFFSLYISSYHFYDILIWFIWVILILILLIISFFTSIFIKERN